MSRVAVLTAAALVAAVLVSCTSGVPRLSGSDRSSPSPASLSPPASTAAPSSSPAQGITSATEIVPAALRRPLHLPPVGPGGACPTTGGRPYSNDLFGGTVLGRGPVVPLVGPSRAWDVPLAERGVLRFRPYSEHRGWFTIKTLWFSFPRYQGPVLIRGRQLDGEHHVVFGEGPSVVDPELPAGPTVNGGHGFREWPGGTWLRAPGCYAWQVDGLDFSNVITFEARFAPSG